MSNVKKDTVKNRDYTGNSVAVYSILGASNHSETEREENDFYATDPRAVDILVNEGGVSFEGCKVWECCCGQGHLSKRLAEFGAEVRSTDLIDRGFGEGNVDFLKTEEIVDMDIVTNPPYKYALEFLEHAFKITSPGNRIFMFLKLTFLESKSRKPFFKEHPPKHIYVFSNRIYCAKNGDFKSVKGSAVCYAWFEFENGFTGETTLSWIN